MFAHLFKSRLFTRHMRASRPIVTFVESCIQKPRLANQIRRLTVRPARDTHALPPDNICEAYWKYNKIKPAELDSDPNVVDFGRGLSPKQAERIHPVRTISSETIAAASIAFKCHHDGKVGDGVCKDEGVPKTLISDPEPCTVYEHDDFPGLQVYSSLLPPEIQVLLLSRIMHRDLSNPHHRTNINADYHVPYPTKKKQTPTRTEAGQEQSTTPATADPSDYLSFFTLPGQSGYSNILHPLTPTSTSTTTDTPKPLKPLNMSQYLLKKLRWLTLGHQYNWPTRSYSGTDLTTFPSDISALVSGIFPFLRPESGVVLLYSSKDYMPVHRDVSEQCERGLASFSLGCDGLFVIARDNSTVTDTFAAAAAEKTDADADADADAKGEKGESRDVVVLRVKSGDVVVMDGETRWAWHAMPKVVGGTCPDFMRAWPAGSEGIMGMDDDEAFERWRGYMENRRLNISCRQVFD